MTYRKKLIEVALPLEAINTECAREKSIRHSHPSTLHLWWARRPLAACRAVLFASIVDDPSSHPEEFPSEESQEVERRRLFDLVERLVKWENRNDPTVLGLAKREMTRYTDSLPAVVDPFCGGGSIPLEAQRLGLHAYASDLNPVAVLMTKALIEIAPKFRDRPPVNESSREQLKDSGAWPRFEGLAEDVRYYGQLIRDEAEKKIGHFYPKAKLPEKLGGGDATVIAWLWARTVQCPNPACGARMPLVRSFQLSSKAGNEAWIDPIVDPVLKSVRFKVRSGKGKPPEGSVKRQGARCLVCSSPVPFGHIREQSRSKGLGTQLMAMVADGGRSRVFLDPNDFHSQVAEEPVPWWRPDEEIVDNPGHTNVYRYGLTKFGDLFTPRQLVALTTFCDLVAEHLADIERDAVAAGLEEDGIPLVDGGNGARAYAEAVATYLGLGVSRMANTLVTIARWTASRQQTVTAFARQAIPMTWDFPDVNPFAGAAGDISVSLSSICEVLKALPQGPAGTAKQLDATSAIDGVDSPLICTDPPYYDNIGYADLADYFYVWLRRALQPIYPNLFSTLVSPKSGELVASPYRFQGDKKLANRFFEEGLEQAFRGMRAAHNEAFPMSLFYAFKQVETVGGDEAGDLASLLVSTGWETMLEGLLKSGFAITGTWPMRSELTNRLVASGANALASSIVLVCRPRAASASLATRRQFLQDLKVELPAALKKLQHGNIAPVDLAQAAIGPGMAVFSRYAKVVEADGSPMRVRTALGLINQALDEVLTAQEGEYDASTRWAVAWFEQFGTQEGPFGVADTLSKAKNTSIPGLVADGILEARKGKVRLLSRAELDPTWDPTTDKRLTVWEVTQHLVRVLDERGESGAAETLKRVGSVGDTARDLAYRLYSTSERKKWTQEALGYNALVVSWSEIQRLAGHVDSGEQQGDLFSQGD